ncbi:toll/interleukin-1 receptor domain-containing protein [Sphingobium sp. AN641]|uniref:toll/interleukin-1 receptor domain-containing protein n=1 Tax=Sphingobium sp. AN641 TaxID=3133443 RepID=UPI0030C1853D
MANPLDKLISGSMDTAAAIGKPVLSGGVDIADRAGRRLGELISGAGERRFAAFISYSHADMDFARWLHRSIENYRVPRALIGTQGERGPIPARLRPLFRDEDELAGAAELGPRLEGALSRSDALIVICSPASAQSIWVDKEIRTFKRINTQAPVFAVIAAGTPEDCFPPSLLFAIDDAGELDRTRPVEPLAPDLEKFGRKTVKLKLIAGLIGTSYGALYRRDRVRARRWAAGLGAAALILILLLSGLSIAAVGYARMAVQQRNEAQAARRLAEENADKAERRAWLAQVAAQEVRRQALLLDSKGGTCPPPD